MRPEPDHSRIRKSRNSASAICEEVLENRKKTKHHRTSLPNGGPLLTFRGRTQADEATRERVAREVPLARRLAVPMHAFVQYPKK